MTIKRYFVGNEIELFTSVVDLQILLADHGLDLKEEIETAPAPNRDGIYYWNRPYPYLCPQDYEFEDVIVYKKIDHENS